MERNANSKNSRYCGSNVSLKLRVGYEEQIRKCWYQNEIPIQSCIVKCCLPTNIDGSSEWNRKYAVCKINKLRPGIKTGRKLK